MKVILVNRYFFPDQSATSRVISSIAIALAQRGVEVVAVASREIHNQPGTMLPAEEVVSGVRVTRLASAGHGRQKLLRRALDYLLFHMLAFFWLLRNASASDIVVVCTDPPLLSVSSSIAVRLRKATMVNWVMDLFPETAIELGFFRRWPVAGRWACRIRDWSLATPGLTVCPTDKMAEYLLDRGLPRDRLTVMHHWSDAEEIYPVAAHDNSLREEWGLKDVFVVGYSGNFGRAHEFSTIIEAARRLRHRDDIRFLLIGGGHQHAEVKAAAHRLQLDNMLFKPLQPVADLAESLSAADVHLVSLLPALEHCIIPSKFYGILAAGRPTIFIGDPDGEVPRVLSAKGCGKSVAIGDSDALVTAIEDMCNDAKSCAAMGSTARRLLLTDYSRNKAADSWYTLIGKLQQTPRPVAPLAQEIAQ
jgi:glycosyltransferase involved in cell wall biosynthesis